MQQVHQLSFSIVIIIEMPIKLFIQGQTVCKIILKKLLLTLVVFGFLLFYTIHHQIVLIESNSDDGDVASAPPFIRENRDYGDEQLDWSVMPLELFDNLTSSLMMDYIKWTNVESCEGIQYFGSNKINEIQWKKIGIVDGQKAICLDPGVAPTFGNCTVYSFGIDYEWSFDESMESYGCKV